MEIELVQDVARLGLEVTNAFGVIDERFGTAFRAKYEGLGDALDKTAASRLT